VTDAPIGVFDSGVGGLTVSRAIIDQLPRESILYVGDTVHSPYGPKPIAAVREYALAVMDDLVAQGVKLLVIACNTASAAVLRDARERYTIGSGIPVVEVIQPAVRSAVRQTRSKRIGVIGTEGTINSRAYEDAFAAASDLQLFTQACPRFVEFVEAGDTSSPELRAVAEQYLAPLREARVDTLVLGCTHYPLMSAAVQYVMGPEVRLVSSADETAADVYRTLVDRRRQVVVPEARQALPGAGDLAGRAPRDGRHRAARRPEPAARLLSGRVPGRRPAPPAPRPPGRPPSPAAPTDPTGETP